MTPEQRAELRGRTAFENGLVMVSRERLHALLDAADRADALQAERDCLDSQCDYYKADLDAIRAMLPNVEGVCTQDLVRNRLQALQAECEALRLQVLNYQKSIDRRAEA